MFFTKNACSSVFLGFAGRLGAAICHIARVYLKLPIFRYVDDFFGALRYKPGLHTGVYAGVFFLVTQA